MKISSSTVLSDNTLTYSELQFPTWKLNIIIPALLPAQVCMCSGEWEANELSLSLLSLSPLDMFMKPTPPKIQELMVGEGMVPRKMEASLEEARMNIGHTQPVDNTYYTRKPEQAEPVT